MEQTTKRHRYENVVVGFTEPSTEDTNQPEHFASKAGGLPIWLYRWPHTPPQIPRCKNCKQPESFLLQIYAPIETNSIPHAQAFHRVLYITICKSSGCNRSSNQCVTVLRAQLPRENSFYTFSAGDTRAVPAVKHVCALCGFWGNLVCGGCQNVRYCSKRCQEEDWSIGHRDVCVPDGGSDTGSALEAGRRKWRFPEMEISTDRHGTPPDSDSEDEEGDEGNEGNEGKESDESDHADKPNEEKVPMTELETPNLTQGTFQDADEDELPEDLFRRREGRCSDTVYRNFQKVVAYEPDQVVRYERGGRVLWGSAEKQCGQEETSRCEQCGGRRVFELQIMPQLLYRLDCAGEHEHGEESWSRLSMIELARRMRDDLDWLTIVVMTCEHSCVIEEGDYVREFAWIQHHG